VEADAAVSLAVAVAFPLLLLFLLLLPTSVNLPGAVVGALAAFSVLVGSCSPAPAPPSRLDPLPAAAAARRRWILTTTSAR
jgi:hypothetical protein